MALLWRDGRARPKAFLKEFYSFWDFGSNWGQNFLKEAFDAPKGASNRRLGHFGGKIGQNWPILPKRSEKATNVDFSDPSEVTTLSVVTSLGWGQFRDFSRKFSLENFRGAVSGNFPSLWGISRKIGGKIFLKIFQKIWPWRGWPSRSKRSRGGAFLADQAPRPQKWPN